MRTMRTMRTMQPPLGRPIVDFDGDGRADYAEHDLATGVFRIFLTRDTGSADGGAARPA
jgi:hypothetical protein